MPSWCSYLTTLEWQYAGIKPGDLIITFKPIFAIHMPIAYTFSGKLMGITKYVEGPGAWKILGYSLSRRLSTYSPTEVAKAAQYLEIDPAFNIAIPILKLETPLIHCKAEYALKQISLKPSTILQYKLTELLSCLTLLNEKLGITGSILIGSEIETSDIDLVVYGYRSALKVYEALQDALREVIRPLTTRTELFKEWVRREAVSRGVDEAIIRSIYAPWSRILYNNSIVSVSLWSEDLPLMRHFYVKALIRKVNVKAFIDSFCPHILGYPIYINEECAKFSDPGVDLLVVFDGVYKPSLWEGGLFEIEGVLAKVEIMGENMLAVLIGLREVTTFMKRLRVVH